jgi:hypothetical protein
MDLQCGRYDTWELNSYWVNEAIAERRCRANPSEIDDGLAWSAKGLDSDLDTVILISGLLPESGHRQADRSGLIAVNRRAQLFVPQQRTFYSIASSAVASSEGGTSRSSILAILKLTTSSNLVGNCPRQKP